MKKLFTVITIIILIIGILYSCKTSKKMTANEKNKYQKVTVGDTISISLKENHSTGFHWEWKFLEGDKNLKFIGTKSENTVPDSLINRGYVGYPIIKTFIFKAIKKGKTTIAFKYIRFNGNVAKRDTFYYVIK